MTKETRRQGQKLLNEIRSLRRAGLDDVVKGLKLLSHHAAVDPQTLPTRQQRRKAERDAAKRMRGAK